MSSLHSRRKVSRDHIIRETQKGLDRPPSGAQSIASNSGLLAADRTSSGAFYCHSTVIED